MKRNEDITRVLEIAMENGYECYRTSEGCIYDYAIIITNNGIPLAIHTPTYNNNYGTSLDIKYKPSKDSSSGCCADIIQDGSNHYSVIKTIDDLNRCRNIGMTFAYSLGAQFYKNDDRSYIDNWMVKLNQA